MADVRLPSRYEDLDVEYRSKLRPVPELNALIQQAFARMKVSGGIRFLPIFGRSGSGKTSAACELGTHIPSCHLEVLTPDEVGLSKDALVAKLAAKIDLFNRSDLFIWVIDQYEEKVETSANVPGEFVEKLSLLDRGALRNQPMVFIWLTTDKGFQQALASATTRNARILVDPGFELTGLPRDQWPAVIEDTFSFHNSGRELADYNLLTDDIEEVSRNSATIGHAIEEVGGRIGEPLYKLLDLSEYQVILLWPVVDGVGIERVKNLANSVGGYPFNWSVWHNQLSADDRHALPLKAYNQARLYFDLRVVPLPAADLHCICRHLEDDDFMPGTSYLDHFKKTHYHTVLSGATDERSFGSLFARDSKRADEGRAWYLTVTTQPTRVGKRLAKCLTAMGYPSQYEQEIKSEHGRIVADVLSTRDGKHQRKVITELKLFSPSNVTPAAIRDEIRSTLRKYAQLAGYISRQ